MKIIYDLDELKNILSNDNIILLPSDTIRGISCFTDSQKAISQINRIKQREESKTMVIIISDDLFKSYIGTKPNLPKFKYPTTIIYRYDQLSNFGKQNISPKLIRDDGTIGIRKVSNHKLDKIISYLGKPLVSTSINISNQPYARSPNQINKDITKEVDYIYKIKHWKPRRSPSHIVTIEDDNIIYLRR